TFVPPVTALRSPPDSRITGALSPVMTDSSTLAIPSITSPSPGMRYPASTRTISPARNREAATISNLSLGRSFLASVSVFVLRRLSACAFPRASAIASAKFAKRTVNHSHSAICTPNRSPPAPVTASLMTNNVVIAAPTSTTNMTGFFATMRGLSFTNDSRIARRRISGSNSGRARTPLEISCDASVVLCSDLRSCGLRVAVDILENLSVQHLEMLDDRTKRQCGEIRQRAHNDHCAGQKNDKQ